MPDSHTFGGAQQSVYWTKKGVVRLGFLIKSPLTIKFRDWAEDYIINKQEVVKTPQIPKNYIEALEAHLLGIEDCCNDSKS